MKINTTFGELTVYELNGKFHASGFSLSAKTVEELVQKCETAFHTLEMNQDCGNYAAGYAYACGYHN